MASKRKTLRTWLIGFALGFLLFSRFRSESSRMKSGFTWGTIAVAGSVLRSRRSTKKETKRTAETETETTESTAVDA